ncbi:UDP-N-acetylmuramoyl-tripeptide--D-alanyl-D-alanine ligase [Candidatus Saccharibacteria bacterium]|nr:UDP-N-acetylmuramoyl-tripeptide--D-alanyl-D-alanine ligase [Candidatus Saccharibacteria bacterium]
MKKAAKGFVATILGWQVRRLYKRNNFKVVAVAGSVGKTSTKLAIANVLKAKYRVQYQNGNYNDLVSVPLIFFGETMPSLFNPVAWISILLRNAKQTKNPYPYDVVVIEVGTDAPGQIKEFSAYLKIDLAILTAVSPEHMEFFDDLDAVAREELDILRMSAKLLYNKDMVDSKYLRGIEAPIISYGLKQKADFQTVDVVFKDDKSDFTVLKDGSPFLKASNDLISEPQLYSVTAAVALAAELGLSAEEIDKGLHNIRPVSGRMQRLAGVYNSIIIDDTYNASPEAMKAALQTLYRLDAPHKIAILGNMNELGKYSKEAHEEIGIHCEPKKLDLVVTIGPDANQYLAPTAQNRGCKVVTFDNPYKAGEYIKPLIQQGSLILAKGSQNGVFAEETVKLLLADPTDGSKLVRQSPEWLKKKSKAFAKG